MNDRTGGSGTPTGHRSRRDFLRIAGAAGIGVAVLPIIGTACVPPGGKLDQRALAKVDPKGQQDCWVSEGVGSCGVKSPDVVFEDATFGFAQSENNNPWRIAQTASTRSAAEANGVELIVTDAQSSTLKQVSDIQDMVAQGVDVLFVPPREEEGMAAALESAASANVPVFFVDREANAQVCGQYITFMGSDFVRQGQRAAGWLARATGGKAKIVELQGTLGASVKVLILDEPTQGIDVGAKAEVQRLISELVEVGLGVVMIDSEPEEMVEGSDRVVVLRDGGVAGTLSGEDLTEQNLVHMIAGSEGSRPTEDGEDDDG